MSKPILIAAMDAGGAIGRDGDIPWRLPEDLRRFRRLTMGNTILMGRRTYDSIGHALDGRENRVLTRDPSFVAKGVRAFHDLDQALAQPEGRLFVIGGAELYRLTLPLAHRLELTLIDANIGGDTFFPDFDQGEWKEVSRESHEGTQECEFSFHFITLERIVKL